MDKKMLKSNGIVNNSFNESETEYSKKSWIGSLFKNLVSGVKHESTKIQGSANSELLATKMNPQTERLMNTTKKKNLALPSFQSIKSCDSKSQLNSTLTLPTLKHGMSPTHQVKYAGFGYTPSVRLNPSIRPTNCLKRSPSSHASVVPLLPNETNSGFSELNGCKVTSDQLIIRLLNEKRKRMMTTSMDDLSNLDNINLVKRRKMGIEKDDDSPQTEPSSYLSASSFTSIELRRPPLKRSCHDDGEEENLNSIRKLKIVDVREVRGAASSIDKTLPTSSACSTDSQLQIPLLQQKQQASYQETCNISKSNMWNTTRNPAVVSHLSSRRYMERKLRDLTKDSISSNSILAASSSRSSCESSSQHGDDHDVTCSGVFGLQHSPVPTDDSSSTKEFLYSALMDEKSSPSKYACLLEKKHTFKREITSDLSKKHEDLTYRFDVTSEDLKKDKNLSYERIHTLMRLKKTSVKKNASVKIGDISDVTSGSNASVPDVIKIVSSVSSESTFSNVTTKSTVAPSHVTATSTTTSSHSQSSSITSLNNAITDATTKGLSTLPIVSSLPPTSTVVTLANISPSVTSNVSSIVSPNVSSSISLNVSSSITSHVSSSILIKPATASLNFITYSSSHASPISWNNNKVPDNVKTSVFEHGTFKSNEFGSLKIPDVVTFAGTVPQQNLNDELQQNIINQPIGPNVNDDLQQNIISQPQQHINQSSFSKQSVQMNSFKSISSQQPSTSTLQTSFSTNAVLSTQSSLTSADCVQQISTSSQSSTTMTSQQYVFNKAITFTTTITISSVNQPLMSSFSFSQSSNSLPCSTKSQFGSSIASLSTLSVMSTVTQTNAPQFSFGFNLPTAKSQNSSTDLFTNSQQTFTGLQPSSTISTSSVVFGASKLAKTNSFSTCNSTTFNFGLVSSLASSDQLQNSTSSSTVLFNSTSQQLSSISTAPSSFNFGSNFLQQSKSASQSSFSFVTPKFTRPDISEASSFVFGSAVQNGIQQQSSKPSSFNFSQQLPLQMQADKQQPTFLGFGKSSSSSIDMKNQSVTLNNNSVPNFASTSTQELGKGVNFQFGAISAQPKLSQNTLLPFGTAPALNGTIGLSSNSFSQQSNQSVFFTSGSSKTPTSSSRLPRKKPLRR